MAVVAILAAMLAQGIGLVAVIAVAFGVGLASGRHAHAIPSALGAMLGVAAALLVANARGAGMGADAALGVAQLGLVVALLHAWGSAGRQLADAIDVRLAARSSPS